MAFDALSTADQVLAGLDLSGRRFLVTGASAGVGVETARALSARGATVIGTARNPDRSKKANARADVPDASGARIELVQLDLASLSSVRSCANELLSIGLRFDGIIANAGLMAGPKALSADGFEAQFATNYLGHFLLINRIAPLLNSGGRVVMVSSAGHRRSDVDLDDPNFLRTAYDQYLAYGRSKTATILLAVEFDRRHRSQGIRAAAVHPGAIQTETVRTIIESLGAGRDAAVAAFDWKTTAQGAATALWAGIVAPANEVGGKYCEDCHVAKVEDDASVKSGVRSYALNSDRAKALWSKGQEMVGEIFPEPPATYE